MHKFPPYNYFYSILITVFITSIGIFIYHNFFDEPTIIFNDYNKAKSVSHQLNKSDIPNSGLFASIIKKSSPAVVSIRSIRKDKNDIYSYDSGSGVCISPTGQIVTNAHVIKGAEQIIVTSDNNKTFKAKPIALDSQTDIAVIKIDTDNFPFIFLGDSKNINIGDWILVIGNPFKLNNSVTAGIISAKNRHLDLLGNQGIESYIQTDAVVNPGNSGGAMIDLQGKMIGMISAIVTENDGFQGFSFAIPSNIVKKVAFDLINYKVVQRAWMGISIKNTEGNTGVIINRVTSKNAADAAGLKSEDIITKINKNIIKTTSHFENIIAQFKPGDIVEVEFLRSGNLHKTKVTLKNYLNTVDLIANRDDAILTNLGFVLRDLTESERIKTSGVMVVSITKDSKLSDINIEPGYIINKINNQEILNVDDFIHKLKNSNKKVELNGIYPNYPGVYPYTFEK